MMSLCDGTFLGEPLKSFCVSSYRKLILFTYPIADINECTMVSVRTKAVIRLAVITASVKLARSWRKMAEDVKVMVRTVCFLIRKERTSM